MDGTSITPEQEKLNALRQILPEAFTEGKVDWEKLKATLGEDINFANERYVLNWAGKSDAFKALQTPTSKSLIPAKDESVNFDETEHIFIEGENLEVLKVLQKSYFGKVKMIYIDPPYNTGNDSFIYPDKFSETRADYEKRVGDKDEEGYMTKDGMFKRNSKENGQYHSNWLNMMMPRLYLAKNLLRQDGVIFISIDDNEVHNLRLLMNEVFGEENFIASISVQLNPRGRNLDKFIAKTHESILVYTKNSYIESSMIGLEKEGKMIRDYNRNDKDGKGAYRLIGLRNRNQAFNPITRPKLYFPLYINPKNGSVSLNQDSLHTIEILPDTIEGIKTCWTWGKSKVEKEKYLLIAEKSGEGWRIHRKDYLIKEDGEKARTLPKSIWLDKEINNDYGKQEIKILFGENVMSFPKSPFLPKKLMEFSTYSDSIIFDFFAGSGTTAHAVMDLNKEDGGNRKCISVQLPELTEEKSEAYKAGYKTIADIAKERIRRAGKKIEKEIQEEIEKNNTQIIKLQSELPTEETKEEIKTLKTKIEQLQKQDLGFKVLKLGESNFKQWQQLLSNDAKALEEQMKLFVDPVSETATIENMVYELLLKSGKDLNSKISPYFTSSDDSQGKKFPSAGGVPEGRGGRNSQNYFNLPYNPKLKERAKKLRQAGNLPEVLFWNQVKNKQFKGFDFDRQKIIGNYIVDFYCSNCNVVIEIDGSSHDDKQDYDAARDAYLENIGLTVIHIPVAKIMNNMSGVMEMLYDHPALRAPLQRKGIDHPALWAPLQRKGIDHPALKGTPPEEGNLNPDFYIINDNELVLMLEKATKEIIDAAIALKPIKVIALDKLFEGNDQLKTNTVLQMKDAGIEFKTI